MVFYMNDGLSICIFKYYFRNCIKFKNYYSRFSVVMLCTFYSLKYLCNYMYLFVKEIIRDSFSNLGKHV